MEWCEALMARVIATAEKEAKPIHGGKMQSKLAWFEDKLNPEELFFLQTLQSVWRSHAIGQCDPMVGWELCDFMFLFGPPGSGKQQWHCDTREDIMVVTVVVRGQPDPTELANLRYTSIDVEDELLEDAAEAMGLPHDWSKIEPLGRIEEWYQEKSALFFFGNAVHRGPGVPSGGSERVSIYSAWGPHGASTEFFVNEKFYNRFRTHTHNALSLCGCVMPVFVSLTGSPFLSLSEKKHFLPQPVTPILSPFLVNVWTTVC